MHRQLTDAPTGRTAPLPGGPFGTVGGPTRRGATTAGRRIWSVLLVGALATATSNVSDVAAAKDPTRASLSCRKVLGRTFRKLARLGFREIDRCQRRARSGQTKRDCAAVLPSESAYRRWAHRTSAFVSERCAANDPVRTTFPVSELPDGTMVGDPAFAIDDVTIAIEASTAALQRRDIGQDDGTTRASAGPSSCRIAIGEARSSVALRVMTEAVQCQRRLDTREHAFGLLDPRCEVAAPDAVVREAAGRIAASCGGDDVGCAPSPGCVIDAAAATGIALARATFGQCGNGVLNAGEDCDDVECAGCRATECGNGRVEGSEECDDGNLIDHDTCTQCRNPICGDGTVDVGAEECDDGNDAPGDGCANCSFEPVVCTERGVVAIVAFEYDPNTFGDIAGLRLRVKYPSDRVTIPGSLVASTVAERVTNLTGISGFFTAADRDLLPSEEAPDGVDDTLQTVVAVAQGELIPSGPFESIRFDCPAGTEVGAGQLECLIVEASDPFTNAYSELIIAQGTRCSLRLEAPPAP